MSKKEDQIVLTVDKLSIQSHTAHAENIADGINNTIEKVCNYLKRELATDEVESLFNAPRDFLTAEVMKGAQFPKADVSFNLTSRGEKPEVFHSLCGICKRNFIKLDSITLQDGKAVVLHDFIKEYNTSYIQTDLQREAYEIAEKLVPLVTRLKELNLGSEAYINKALQIVGADGRNGYEIEKECINSLKLRR